MGQAPDVSRAVRSSLDHAGFKDISVSQNRAKGVVILNGHLPSEERKSQAEYLAQLEAPGQVVFDEIAVLPAGSEKDATRVDRYMDREVGMNIDTALEH